MTISENSGLKADRIQRFHQELTTGINTSVVYVIYRAADWTGDMTRGYNAPSSHYDGAASIDCCVSCVVADQLSMVLNICITSSL